MDGVDHAADDRQTVLCTTTITIERSILGSHVTEDVAVVPPVFRMQRPAIVFSPLCMEPCDHILCILEFLSVLEAPLSNQAQVLMNNLPM